MSKLERGMCVSLEGLDVKGWIEVVDAFAAAGFNMYEGYGDKCGVNYKESSKWRDWRYLGVDYDGDIVHWDHVEAFGDDSEEVTLEYVLGQGKTMTPFEKAGYPKETKFKILQNCPWSSGFKKGDVVTLEEDDGSDCPYFTDGLVRGYLCFPPQPAAEGKVELLVEDKVVEASTPETDPEGWIPNPGHLPVPSGTRIDAKYVDGKVAKNIGAGDWENGDDDINRTAENWELDTWASSITHFRLTTVNTPVASCSEPEDTITTSDYPSSQEDNRGVGESTEANKAIRVSSKTLYDVEIHGIVHTLDEEECNELLANLLVVFMESGSGE